MKRSYTYGHYWIELTTTTEGQRFEALANIFVSREDALHGAGPVYAVTGSGVTEDEATKAAEAKVKAWADGPGAPPKGGGR
jgi:hypothetical protein